MDGRKTAPLQSLALKLNHVWDNMSIHPAPPVTPKFNVENDARKDEIPPSGAVLFPDDGGVGMLPRGDLRVSRAKTNIEVGGGEGSVG